jgi:protein ImuB
LALHVLSGRHQVIAAADREARSAGVRAGMALAHARALSPDLQARPLAAEEDGVALERLAEWCLWLSPLVAVDPPDGIWIDSTGCDHLHGGEAAMLIALEQRLQARGYACRLALADTPGAAHALARFGEQARSVLPSGAEVAALADMPVAALRLAPDAVEGLMRLGMRTIGALHAAPRGPLVRRFGRDVMNRLDQTMGMAREPIKPLQPREAIAPRRSFVEPIGTAEAIATVIQVLVEEASAELVRRGWGARVVDLLCERVDGTTQPCRVGMATPVHDPGHLAHLLQARIETIEPGFGIEAMQLVVVQADPLGNAGQEKELLSAGRAVADPSRLLDRLRNRVGADRVYRLASADSHIPERTQSRVRLHELKDETSPSPQWFSPSPRPARLLTPPERIDVVSALPADPPRLFTWRGVRHEVRAADGPERIHAEWWRSAEEYGAVRDYWIVESRVGERFWLFRRGDWTHDWSGDCRWFLQGVF